MKVSDLFPSRFVTHDELRGKAITVVIDRVEIEKVRDGFEKKDKDVAVVYFAGAKKGLCLNKTNALTMARIFGSDDTESWIGKQVTISPTFWNGKKTIRVSAPPSQGMPQ